MCVRPAGRGPAGRSAWRRTAGWGPPLDGACALTRGIPALAGKAASNGSAMPGLRRARAPRVAKASMPVFVDRTPLSAFRCLRSPADAAVAAVAVTIGLRGPASTLSFFRISPIHLWDAPAQERDKSPAWTGNEKRE